jgi:hypothetical protein
MERLGLRLLQVCQQQEEDLANAGTQAALALAAGGEDHQVM